MTTPSRSDRYRKSRELLDRARSVIPSGIWGHNRFPAFLSPGNYPYFAHRAREAHFVDVDGNEYVDYICGYGAMINGYANPAVDRAATARLSDGDCLNQPTEVSVELAELLCSLVRDADWCAFGKNGSDALLTAIVIARAHTSRQDLVCINGSYHGSHLWCNWCNPGKGRPPDDSRHVHRVDWNNIDQMRETFEHHGEQIAAVLMTPFHHPIGARAELPAAGYWNEIEKLCRHWGSLLIVDDVRTGYRLDMTGSHAYFGFRPDLVCQCKAIANTYPLSAVLGVESLREAAESVFAAGTFWGASSPMAAAIENLKLLGSNGRFDAMWRLSKRLAQGLAERAAAAGLTLEVTGPTTIPTVTFAGDSDFSLMNQFAERMVEQGSFVHPLHNWFLSAAHTDEDINLTLRHAEQALDRLTKRAKPAAQS